MELIDIKLTLEAEFFKEPPVVTAKINDDVFYNDLINDSISEINTTHQCEYNRNHCIQITRSGKTNSCPEQLLKVTSVEIDGTNIRDIVWHTSVFYPEYPEPWATEQKQKGIELEYPVYGETILGHNGVWEFNFSSPFYQFLINKVKGQ